jgi:hypothetical protein
MSSSKKKSDFSWKSGQAIKSEEYDALGNVRSVGFSKLADALHVDPELRKQKRLSKLKGKNSTASRKEDLVIDESNSGISENYTPSDDNSRLIGKPDQFKGFDRFKPQNKK